MADHESFIGTLQRPIGMTIETKIVKLRPAAFAVFLLVAGHAYGVGNGVIASGTGSIGTNGATTTVSQSSDKLIVNWDNMNVAQHETLSFNQPGATAAVLNRINSADPTQILGALQANGRVFVVNPNGVLIGNSARIDVGSLVASSLAITDKDFNAGKLRFSGDTKGTVLNDGRINARDSVGLIGPQTRNTGSIRSAGGDIVLAAGSDVSLNFSGSNLSAAVSESAVHALVENGGLITTDNGDIILTARARDALARTVVNNTGVLEAKALDAGGRITLVGEKTLFRGRTPIEANGDIDIGGSVKAANVVTAEADSVRFGGNLTTRDFYVRAGNRGLPGNIVTTDSASLNVTGHADLAHRFAYGRNTWPEYWSRPVIDMAQGTNRIASLAFTRASSADIALTGDTTVTGHSLGKIRLRSDGNLDLRGNGSLNMPGIWAPITGDVDIATTGDVLIGTNVESGTGNVRISGKNVRAISVDYGPWSERARTGISAPEGAITVNATEKADLAAAAGRVNGKKIQISGQTTERGSREKRRPWWGWPWTMFGWT